MADANTHPGNRSQLVNADALPTRIAGRYRVDGVLGRGASAEVYDAFDEATGTRVAVKRLHRADPEDRARLARELGALALLDLPGVVRPLDHGVDRGHPFVVMERVDGSPFPGDAFGDPVEASCALLETLGQVHARGIVHRDLKPDNVLVTPDKRIVVLDFGLARGEVLGATMTTVGAVLGTPRYLAPEQVLGGAVDLRADLYAVGVMLFEALAGRPPHTAETWGELWRSRTEPAPSITSFVSDLPAPVARLIDQLLAPAPEARPTSASACLTVLRAEQETVELPWLGSRRAVEEIRGALASGHSVHLRSEPGLGRTRVLSAAAAELTAVGRRVRWLARSTEPLGSLAEIVVPTRADDGASALDEATVAVREHFASGGVVVVDRAEWVDPWSAAVLGDLGSGGAILTGRPAVGCALQALSERDLLALFEGPDRVLHLREDAARELFRRTMGVPARIDAELRGWVDLGLATRVPPDGGRARFRVARSILDRLAAGMRTAISTATEATPEEPCLREHVAWTGLVGPGATVAVLAELVGRPAWCVDLERRTLIERGWIEELPGGEVRALARVETLGSGSYGGRAEAHRRVAAALPPGAPERLEHLVLGGRHGESAGAREVIREALVVAEGRLDGGDAARAIATVARVVNGLPHAFTWVELRPLLGLAVRAAVSLGTTQGFADVRGLLMRAGGPDDAAERTLLDAATHARQGRPAEGLARLEALPAFDDEALELCRQAERVTAADRLGAARLAELLDELEPWIATHDSRAVRAQRLTWRGLLHYRRQEHRAAADCHDRALELRDNDRGRLASLANAAEARLWQPDLEAAVANAHRALELATRLRHPGYAALAERILRAVAHRRGATEPDLELVSALPHDPAVLYNEAMVACRGRHHAAPDLVARTARLWAGKRTDVPQHALAMLTYLGLDGGDEPRLDLVPPDMRVDIERLLTGQPASPLRDGLFSGVLS